MNKHKLMSSRLMPIVSYFGTIWIFISSSLIVNADISKYFKKIEDKSDIHKLPNIDFIYMINLDARPERLKQSLKQLHPFGIYPYRFCAVNGFAFTVDELNDMGMLLSPEMNIERLAIYYSLNDDGIPVPTLQVMNEYGKKYCDVTPGEIGCLLSHLSILQDAYDSNYETIWIMEDDIEVLRDPRIISHLIERLDRIVGRDQWDILFTDFDRRLGDHCYQPNGYIFCRPDHVLHDTENPTQKKRVNQHFIKIRSRVGAHSMIVRRNGIKKTLDFIKTHGIFLPIDHEFNQIEGLRLFALRKDLVSNRPESTSDTMYTNDPSDPLHRNNFMNRGFHKQDP